MDFTKALKEAKAKRQRQADNLAATDQLIQLLEERTNANATTPTGKQKTQ